MFGGEILNEKKLNATISKQRRLQQKMLKAIHSVSSRGRVLWAKVRRWVRMHHYAHKLWEYKFSSRAAQLDIRSNRDPESLVISGKMSRADYHFDNRDKVIFFEEGVEDSRWRILISH